MKKKTPSHQNFYKFCTTPWTYCSEYEPKASIVWWVAQVHCLYIEDEDWLVCFDCDALEMKKKDSFAPGFLQVLHHARDVLFRVRTKSLYCLMGCTGSLFIHRGWRLAGLFRLWRPGNEKKRLLRTRIFTSSAPRPGRIVPSTNQKASVVWWVAQVHCLYIEDEDWLVCFDCDALEMKKRLLRTRIFTSSAPRPGRIVPSTTQKASIDRWVAQVHCWYIEDEDWLVCFDCDALEMKKRLLRTRILTSSAPRPGRIVPSTNQKASIDRWVAQVHCLYIEDEDWQVCFDCDALERKKKDSFAPEFLQVLHHALDVLFRVRTKSL